jgi:hypothetical protein
MTATWLMIVGLIVLLLGLLAWSSSQTREGFALMDRPTAQAQRQQLQWEGERRYNNLARVQDPSVKLDPDQVDLAFRQAIPVGTTNTAGLQTLLTAAKHGPLDNSTNKQGSNVEQTGTIQDKVAFCESITTVNCNLLGDPRAAECGFCHRDGLDSTGKAHRGGMYISTDDQIRANQVSNANGQAKAVYQPTVGSCKPENFTLNFENCQAREAQLMCQQAGAPTSSNQCAQCYGKPAPNATGLLVVGAKPRRYNPILTVSHPGRHPNNGAGTTITVQRQGTLDSSIPQTETYFLAASPTSGISPAQVQLMNIAEGDSMTIQVFGMPQAWCGWLSSADGKRTVSLDIGEQSISPANNFLIAGDKNSNPVKEAIAKTTSSGGPDPTDWIMNTVPNTVLWYQRRNEFVPGTVDYAWFGATPTSQGIDVTDDMRIVAGTGSDFLVSLSTINAGDPAPGIVKHLWINQDTGNSIIGVEGQTLSGAQLFNSMVMAVTVPATLVDPLYADDLADCPSGPLVFTEIGAGLMGSHSCFKPDGTFNPVPYCLQELFQAAGGTQQGQAFPNSDAKAAALVQKDSAGNPSLDATVAYLNNQGNIAIYGVDVNGAQVSYDIFKAASMMMFGTAPTNPCQGPTASTGPHSAECLDYLYRTMNNPEYDTAGVEPTSIPYLGCSAAGEVAPLNPDGSVNASMSAAANAQGGLAAVRQYFQGFYNRARDNSDFDAQASAMRQCYNTNLVPPPETPSTCPPPAPGDWQCFTPDMFQGDEVYSVCPNGGYDTVFGDADAVCRTYGSRLASPSELVAAQARGAQWCACGWTSDANANYPMQGNAPYGCGNSNTVNWCGTMTQSLAWGGQKANAACVTCVGKKPPQGTPDVNEFAPGVWNDPTAVGIGQKYFPNNVVPAFREVSNQVQCYTTDGGNCFTFPDGDSCKAWAATTIGTSDQGQAVQISSQESDLTAYVDKYIRLRV